MMDKGNDLFYVCSLIEYIGRERKLRRADVVSGLGEETIRRIYRYADTFHCEQIAKVAAQKKRGVSDAGTRGQVTGGRHLDAFARLSGAGTQIGIGVASGADDIYVDPQQNTEIERDCLLPLVASEDIRGGRIEWNSRYMLNPYDQNDDRRMRDLAMYPKTGAYLMRHADRLKSRYCARMHPDAWYRTLDRISYGTFHASKLLLPDIQLGGNVALDERGEYYPHHNVYWITSRSWNLRALCVIMRSSFVTEQLRRLSMQMRGGSIRYQAQNLRKVHIPAWESLAKEDVEMLDSLYGEDDTSKIDACVELLAERLRDKQPRKSVVQEFDFGI